METESESRRTFKVCSFNIRNGDADDGPNSWPHRADTVVRLLQQIDADIFGLQEVLEAQLDSILDGMPEYASIGVGRIDGAVEGEFAPILFRTDRLKLVDYGWFWISETPEIPNSKSWETACERICTWCDFTFKGNSFRAMNTHLDHISEEARLEGAKLLLSRTNDLPTVIMGDFNALPEEAPVQAIRSSGFLDSLEGKSKSTFHNWGTEDNGQIDYIFFRDLGLDWSWVIEEQQNGRDASDHYPVVATVRLG